MTSTPDPNQKLQTLSIPPGRHVDPATGAVTTPLYTSTTFERDADGEFSRHYFYSRIDNPNRSSLEQCLADLEGGVELRHGRHPGRVSGPGSRRPCGSSPGFVLWRPRADYRALRPLGAQAFLRGHAECGRAPLSVPSGDEALVAGNPNQPSY